MGRDEANSQHERPKKGLKELKREIVLNQYDIDAAAVADAIVSKIRLLRQGRLAIDDRASGRTHLQAQQHRPTS